MMFIFVCVSCLLILVSSETVAPPVDLQLPAAAEGEQKYNELLRLASTPKYGSCWTSALSKLQQSCRALSDQQQQSLALAFTNCHLVMSGKGELTCETQSEPSDCTSRMSDLVFQIYTSFFTHSENLCFFIQAQLWQQWQSQTVQALADSAASVVDQLEQSKNVQHDILTAQSQTLDNQKRLLNDGNEMRDVIYTVFKDVENTMTSTNEKLKADFAHLYYTIEQLRSLVVGEYVWLNSAIFFAVSLIIIYIVTSTPRTHNARFWLITISVIELILEIGVLKSHLLSNDLKFVSNELIYRSQWTLRKTSGGMVVVVLFYFVMTYKDLNSENHRILLELRSHVLSLSKGGNAGSDGVANEEHCATSALTQSVATSDCCLSGCEIELQTFMDEREAMTMNDDLPEVEEHESMTPEEDESVNESSSDSESAEVPATPRQYHLRPRQTGSATTRSNPILTVETSDDFALSVLNQSRIVREVYSRRRSSPRH